MMALLWSIISPLKKILGVLLAITAISVGSYFYGKHVANEEHELAALQKTVRDLTVIQVANEADSLRLAQQQTVIANLEKEIDDARRQLSRKDRVCFEPADTEQLRKLWKR